MKILCIIGSMKKDGNTNRLAKFIVEEAKRLNSHIATDFLYASELSINPCKVVCSAFCTKTPHTCAIKDDLSLVLDKIRQADAVLLASPLYINIPATLNTLLERLVQLAFMAETNGIHPDPGIKGKPCALVAVAEYTDPSQVLEHLHRVALCLKMRPLLIQKYPYIGVSGQGKLEDNSVLSPFERGKDLAHRLVEELHPASH